MKNRWGIPDDDPDTIAQAMADMAPEEDDWEQHYIDAHDDEPRNPREEQ